MPPHPPPPTPPPSPPTHTPPHPPTHTPPTPPPSCPQAFLKGISRRGRYMALPHREELLELALDAFAVSKNQRMHELLVQVSIVGSASALYVPCI